MTVLECLDRGAENAVSLEYVVAVTGMSERAVRDEFFRITTSGEEVVCTDGVGKGYYLAADAEEARRYQKYNKSYWLSGIEKDKGIRRFIDRMENEDQMKLFKE